MRTFRIPMPVQILMMVTVLAFGGAYLLLGQQAPSEESDWPWKVVTEGKVFLNGAPAGQLSDLKPLTKKLGTLLDQGRRTGKLDRYAEPQVLIVADPDVSIGRIADLSWSVIEGTGEPILVSGATLDKPLANSKPNPSAFVVTTENVDVNKAKRLANLTDSEVSSAGYRIGIVYEGTPNALRYARTYESSIEISSDGKYFLNELIAKSAARSSTNVEGRISDSRLWSFNSNQAVPVVSLKQRMLPSAELPSAVANIAAAANAESQAVFIIASEKARYDSLLKILEGIERDTRIVVMVRRVGR